MHGRPKSIYDRNTQPFNPNNMNKKSGAKNSRRSEYIGVSKNGKNWQVLINCGKDKKYIGTYTDEKEAAVAYDFDSICLHACKAKTNFTYDAAMILKMVDNYNSESQIFNSKLFVDLV